MVEDRISWERPARCHIKTWQDPCITVDMFTDKEHNLLGIFYQDKTIEGHISGIPRDVIQHTS